MASLHNRLVRAESVASSLSSTGPFSNFEYPIRPNRKRLLNFYEK